MTNLQAIRVNISDAHGVILTQDHFVKALVDVGLVADDEYTSSALINRATLKLYDIIIATANISEGALSYNINVDAVRKERDKLAAEIGVEVDRRNAVNTARPW